MSLPLPRIGLAALCSLGISLGWPAAAAALQVSATLSSSRTATVQDQDVAAPSASLASLGSASASAVDAPALLTPADSRSQQVVAAAMELLGTRYRYGHDGDDGLDCSAMVRRAYSSVGLLLPRSSREMLGSGRPVGLQQLRAGDVLIYRWGRTQLHAALYLGDGSIIHASPEAGQVIVTHLDQRWRKRLVAARRVL